MLGMILAAAALTVTLGGGILAFGFARGFVRRRLRFVEAIRSPVAPVLAAVGAAILVMPLTLLPLVTGVTAAVVGLGAGLGTRSGVKALQRGDVA